MSTLLIVLSHVFLKVAVCGRQYLEKNKELILGQIPPMAEKALLQ